MVLRPAFPAPDWTVPETPQARLKLLCLNIGGKRKLKMVGRAVSSSIQAEIELRLVDRIAARC